MRLSEVRRLAQGVVDGRGAALPFLGEGHFSQVFSLPGDKVLKVSGRAGFGGDEYPDSYELASMGCYDGWQFFAHYAQQNPDKHLAEILHFEMLDDAHAFGIMPAYRPVRGAKPRALRQRWEWYLEGWQASEAYKKAPRWLRNLKAFGQEHGLRVDMHSANSMLDAHGRLRITDPFAHSRTTSGL